MLQFHKKTLITIYNIVTLVRGAIKFLGRNFLFIKKVQAFLDIILSLALAREKIILKGENLRDIEKI